MLSCIICNENPEKSWPKRWQCWKDNGKFSESLCKLLDLPTFPYKVDFQNALYCSSCQKRVYNVYLMVRKWDKLQDEISKLKKDFQQSLQKGEISSSEEHGKSVLMHSSPDEEEEGESQEKKARNIGDMAVDSGSLAEVNTLVRRRILKRLDRANWDCDCCCDTDEGPVAVKNGKSHCGFPDCQDKDCSLKWRKDVTRENDSDNDDESNSSRSEWSSHQENQCDNELCGFCCTSAEGNAGETPGNKHDNATHKAPCSSEYCADCSICKNEARKARKETNIRNKRIESWTTTADVDKNGEFDNENLAESNNVASAEENSVIAGKLMNKKTINDVCPGESSGVGRPGFQGGKSSLAEAKTEDNDDSVDTTISTEDGLKCDSAERFRCCRSNCTRTFLTQEDLDIHVKRHHEGVKCPYVCEQCGKGFQWRRELSSHVLKHSGQVAICCHLCGRGFRTKQLFNVHLKTKHGGERKFKCTMCDKSFISESKLNTHLTIHTKVYPFACTICGKGFSAKTFLNFHMSKHMEANPYQCTTCSKTFSSPRNLKVHQYTHTNTHPFKCTVCQAGATSETLLKKHMLKHNSEKSNICHICNKKFRFPSSLKKHQKVHSGEKKFKCEYCNKTFIDKYKLTRHLRTHSGDKPFHCTLCKKNFATKEYLNKHNIQHHEKDLAKDNYISSRTLDPTSDLLPINSDDLELLEINDPLSTFLTDGFSTDPIFLDNLNTVDDDLVVTALDLENFSKDNEELMITNKESESTQRENNSKDISVPNSVMLPDFQSLRRSSSQLNHDFPNYTFQPL